MSFFFCKNAGFSAISFLNIEIARWRVFTTLKGSASFFAEVLRLFSLTALSALAAISRWRHLWKQCCQHQSLLSEHVVRKKQQGSSSKTMGSTGKEAKPTVAVSTGAAQGYRCWRQVFHYLCWRGVKYSWSRRDGLHDRCRCSVYCWCWRENFLLVAVVMRLAFTPFCISVERLELNICVCRRLVCESCNKPIAVSPRAVARSKATCCRWLLGDDKPVTFERTRG